MLTAWAVQAGWTAANRLHATDEGLITSAHIIAGVMAISALVRSSCPTWWRWPSTHAVN